MYACVVEGGRYEDEGVYTYVREMWREDLCEASEGMNRKVALLRRHPYTLHMEQCSCIIC